MIHANASHSASDRIAPSLKAVFWGVMAGGLALAMSHSVLSPVSPYGECFRGQGGATQCAAARSEPYYFPSQFKAPEGEPAEPIAQF